MNNDVSANLDKIHTTELGVERISKNLNLSVPNVVEWCKLKIKSAKNITRKGKNWYAHIDDFVMTINARSFTIITAHKKKEK